MIQLLQFIMYFALHFILSCDSEHQEEEKPGPVYPVQADDIRYLLTKNLYQIRQRVSRKQYYGTPCCVYLLPPLVMFFLSY